MRYNIRHLLKWTRHYNNVYIISVSCTHVVLYDMTYLLFELITTVTTVTTVTKLLKTSFSRDNDALVSLWASYAPKPPPPVHRRQPYHRVSGRPLRRCCCCWCCNYCHSPDARTPCRCRQWRQSPLKLYKYILLYRLHRWQAWVGTR